jgi:hypothetical protein
MVFWVLVGIAGILLLGVAYLVVRPTLSSGAGPPPSWTLALGDRQRFPSDRTRLRVWMRTASRCGNQVHVTGLFAEQLGRRGAAMEDAILAVDGLPIENVRFYQGLGEGDPFLATEANRTRAELPFDHTARDGIPMWQPRPGAQYFGSIGFSFDVAAAHKDGYDACWVSVPQLLPHRAGWDDERYPPHRRSPFEQLLAGAESYDSFDIESAAVSVVADGWLPDTASIGTTAVVAPNLGHARGLGGRNEGPVVRTACSPPGEGAVANEPMLSMCQGSNRFMRAGSAARASRLTLLSGLIFSAGLTLIIEALLNLGKAVRRRRSSASNRAAD